MPTSSCHIFCDHASIGCLIVAEQSWTTLCSALSNSLVSACEGRFCIHVLMPLSLCRLASIRLPEAQSSEPFFFGPSMTFMNAKKTSMTIAAHQLGQGTFAEAVCCIKGCSPKHHCQGGSELGGPAHLLQPSLSEKRSCKNRTENYSASPKYGQTKNFGSTKSSNMCKAHLSQDVLCGEQVPRLVNESDSIVTNSTVRHGWRQGESDSHLLARILAKGDKENDTAASYSVSACLVVARRPYRLCVCVSTSVIAGLFQVSLCML